MPTDNKSQSVGYAERDQVKAPPWHGLVAWDMLFNGLTTGLFLVAALGELAEPSIFERVARIAYPVAFVFLVIDLIFLVIDLGDPWRFHHMLRVFKPGSPMSLGVWSLTAYSLPLALAALLCLLPGGPSLEWVRKAAVVLALVPAVASMIYKGVLLSTSAQPGWKDARWLGGYHTSGAVVLGCAEAIVLAYMTGEPRVLEVLRPALGVLLVVHAIPSALLYAELRPALQRVLDRGQRWRAAALVSGGGLLVPLCLVLFGSGPIVLLTASLLIFLGNLSARFVLVKLPQPGSG